MAKFEEVYEDTLRLFNTHIGDSSIPSFLRVKILSNEGLKDTPGKVSKAQGEAPEGIPTSAGKGSPQAPEGIPESPRGCGAMLGTWFAGRPGNRDFCWQKFCLEEGACLVVVVPRALVVQKKRGGAFWPRTGAWIWS